MTFGNSSHQTIAMAFLQPRVLGTLQSLSKSILELNLAQSAQQIKLKKRLKVLQSSSQNLIECCSMHANLKEKQAEIPSQMWVTDTKNRYLLQKKNPRQLLLIEVVIQKLWSVNSFSQDSSLSVITFLGQTAVQMLIKEKKLVQYHSSTNSGGYSFDTVCWCHKKRGGRRRPQCRNRQQKQQLVFPVVRRDSEEHWEEKIIERNILICNRVNKSQLYF